MQSGMSLPSKKKLWASRILTALVALFFTLDSVIKFLKPPPVVAAFTHLGLPMSLSIPIGVLLLLCTAIYLMPGSAFIGAILLTGYLGGAIAIHLRVGDPLFETIFPSVFGVLVWAGLFLRDEGLLGLLRRR
jgi:DoxX-like family